MQFESTWTHCPGKFFQHCFLLSFFLAFISTTLSSFNLSSLKMHPNYPYFLRSVLPLTLNIIRFTLPLSISSSPHLFFIFFFKPSSLGCEGEEEGGGVWGCGARKPLPVDMQSATPSNQHLWELVTNGARGGGSTLNTYETSAGISSLAPLSCLRRGLMAKWCQWKENTSSLLEVYRAAGAISFFPFFS